MCIEDAAVLSEILADRHIKSYADVDNAFAVYDEVRRPRGEFLIRSSRFTGECWDLREPSIKDFKELEKEILRRNAIIHEVDVGKMCKDARAKLGS